jgi:low affinity Fe/Cu permease
MNGKDAICSLYGPARDQGKDYMTHRRRKGLGSFLERFSMHVTRWTGSTTAFASAFAVVLLWLMSGPFFGYSDTWQLVINTGTTIVTFLMVFLIQQTQNKDGLAIQLKLNEVVAALDGASNRLISVEDLTSEELETLHAHYRRLAEMAREAADTRESHSVEEAERRHVRKAKASKR